MLRIQIIKKIILILYNKIMYGVEIINFHSFISIKIIIINNVGMKKIFIENEIFLGIIDEIIKNKIINPPTIIKYKEIPIHEFLKLTDIIILVKIVYIITKKIILLDDFSEFIIKINEKNKNINDIRNSMLYITNINFWFTKSMYKLY